ncbi:probable tubulin polyglutamylase ttll-15 [Gigantopelta aegis]|uniref:probable tubulin polyglutamylase ttll-15 n=1 Tax=Gigantopelta aegis TaxID=1735272 RepID=UPI001B889501|nr:probable tubulin polyglutamylase ttll-15 [Gigantopelta aegis]
MDSRQYYRITDEERACGQKYRMKSPSNLIYIVAIILFLGIVLTVLNIYELHKMKEDHSIVHNSLQMPQVEAKEGKMLFRQPIVWVLGTKLETGYLKHVFNVFERLNYAFGDQESDWDILWSHDYPFVTLSKQLTILKPHQRVNHFPGSGYITNKASLATTKMKFIPKAFQIPMHKNEFLAYTKQNPGSKWVQKSNNHRGVVIRAIPDLDLKQEGTFVQEYVSKPYLIDGRKFDIGVYTILTSINPLRLYVLEGDVLFRFCIKDYYPFDQNILEKYVVKDDYTPVWQLPSLKKAYDDMNYSFKDTFNYYLQKEGKDYKKVWSDIKAAILTVYLDKEPNLIESAWKYKTTRNFFEMVRFDFVLDEDLNVYLMEANMSPNLSSAHFRANSRLYEHVIFNLLGLVGLAKSVSYDYTKRPEDEGEMTVSDKDIQVFADICGSDKCRDHCTEMICKLCNKCLTTEWKGLLKETYLEHTARGSCRRVFPRNMTQSEAGDLQSVMASAEFTALNDKNKMISLWFMGKCREDQVWCS